MESIDEVRKIATAEGREMSAVLAEMVTYYKKLSMGNHLAFECSAQSNGYKGGDQGHGGVAHFSMRYDQGVWELEIEDNSGKVHKIDQPQSLKVLTGGDWELDSLLDLAKAILLAIPLPPETT